MLGSPGGAGPQRPPSPAVRSPGGCSPLEGGGERQAGAEAGLGRPPPLAFRLPPPGSVPAAPRPGVGPHARGRPARGSSSACPRQGWFCQEYVGTPTGRHPPITPRNLLCHHAPKQRQPPKSERGCVFPYLSASPGEPRGAGVLCSARVLLPCPAAETSSGRGRGRCGGAGLGRGDPAAGESRTPRAVFICRKKGNLSAYTKNRGC